MSNRRISFGSLPPTWHEEEYDLILTTVGYEARARFMAQRYAPRGKTKVSCGFTTQQVLEYENNAHWFESNGYSVEHKSEKEFRVWLFDLLARLCRERSHIKLLVDISSATRLRIAHTLLALRDHANAEVTACCTYSLAAFTPPPTTVQANSHVGPVTAEFAGWWEEPDRGLVAVVGLGYEEEKALGAVEHLQAAEVWSFVPTSIVAEYSAALLKANKRLLDNVPPTHQLSYRVEDPIECAARLESLVFGLSQSRNPVLLPFGPKIFTLCSLLVGMLHPNIPVWRVSAEGQEIAVNRQPSSVVYGMEITMSHIADTRKNRSAIHTGNSDVCSTHAPESYQ